MPAGVEIINDFGSILIDSINPTLVHVGTYTNANLSYSSLGGTLGLTDATDETLFAYNGEAASTLSHVFRHSATSRDYWFPGLIPSVPFKLYRFERVRDLGSRIGLVLYNGQGQVTFDALQKPGRVIGAVNTDINIAVPAGRVYATTFASSYWRVDFTDYEDGTNRFMGSYFQTRAWNVGNVLYFRSAHNFANNVGVLQPGQVVPSNRVKGAALGVILDVTNY